jgi:RNA polymerase sigma factor (sigma-70 family)
MPRATLDDVVVYLRRVCAVEHHRDQSDRQLLDSFVADGDQAAFAVLMHRHGPLVFGVCRRVAGDHHTAEDCFQGTFLVLARRASRIREKNSLGSWLYGVAQRIASRANAQAVAQRTRERRSLEMPRAEPLDELTWQELRGVLDEEIGRLAEKYRAAIILCHLEGKSHAQAAKELGWPKDTVTRRVGRGRELLRQQLVRRGITLSAAALATSLGEKALAAPVAAMLTINTLKAVTSIAAGQAVTAGWLSERAITLAEEALIGMAGIKAKVILLAVVLGLAVGGAGLASYGGVGEKKQAARTAIGQTLPASIDQRAQEKKDAPTATDLYGDPLPAGAVARLGTVRFRLGSSGIGSSGSTAFDFLADSKTVVSTRDTHVVQFWDAATGKLQREVSTGTMSIQSFALSRDSKYFAVSGSSPTEDRTRPRIAIGVWETASGKLVRTLPRDDSDSDRSPLAFTPDGRLLISLASNGVLRIEEIATGVEKVRRHFPKDNAAGNLVLSADGSMVAVAQGPNSNKLYLWKWQTAEEPLELTSPDRDRFGSNMAFSPDGKTLADCGVFNGVRIWDVASGRVLHKLEPPNSELDRIAVVASFPNAVFAADGKTLIFSTKGDMAGRGGIYFWDATTWKYLGRLDNGVGRLAVSPDSRLFAAIGRASMRVWDLASRKELAANDKAHRADVDQIAAATNLVATGSNDHSLRLWDITTGQQRFKLSHDSWVLAIALSPDGNTIGSTGHDDTSVLWDVASGRALHRLAGHGASGGASRAVEFTPDSKHFLSWGEDMILRKWDVATGKLALEHALRLQGVELPDAEIRKKFPIIQGNVGPGVFSRDGKTLVLRGPNGLHVIDVATGKDLHLIPTEKAFMSALAISPDSRLLLASGRGPPIATKLADGQPSGLFTRSHIICLWELATLQVRKKVLFSDGVVGPVAFSPDNKLFAAATGDPDCSIRIWDMANGKEVSIIHCFRGRVVSLAFASDSNRLISGMDDTTALVWDLKLKRKE